MPSGARWPDLSLCKPATFARSRRPRRKATSTRLTRILVNFRPDRFTLMRHRPDRRLPYRAGWRSVGTLTGGVGPMKDRRASARSKVLLGGIAEINASHPTMDCVVRNLSEDGACVEVDSDATLPAHMKLVIAQKGRSYLARLMWRQANRVGLAFMAMITDAEA